MCCLYGRLNTFWLFTFPGSGSVIKYRSNRIRNTSFIYVWAVNPHWFNADPDPDPAFFLIPETDPDPVPHLDFLWPKIEKKIKFVIFLLFFVSKIAIYLSLGLHKGSTSYRRSLQTSKENIQHFKTWKFFTFFYICESFLPSWIRIQPLKLMRIHADAQPCLFHRFLHHV